MLGSAARGFVRVVRAPDARPRGQAPRDPELRSEAVDDAVAGAIEGIALRDGFRHAQVVVKPNVFMPHAPATTDPRQTPFEELKLAGITKTRQGWNAVLETSQGFPLVVQVGDRFSDGYIISINETQVVFRKTHERGIPLMRARDIIKEINPEER